jgi:hypothetical protein
MSDPVNPVHPVRPEFIARMNAELVANAHKGDWTTWLPSQAELGDELWHHYRKLLSALAGNERARVAEYSADLANLAMKAHQLFGE